MSQEGNAREADLSRILIKRGAISLLLILALALSCTREAAVSDPPSDEAPQPQGDVILALDGEGEAISDHFEVEGNWELRWESRGSGAFSVELFSDDGASRGIIAQGEGGEDGSAFASEEGRFSLLITAEGPWSIRVLGDAP